MSNEKWKSFHIKSFSFEKKVNTEACLRVISDETKSHLDSVACLSFCCLKLLMIPRTAHAGTGRPASFMRKSYKSYAICLRHFIWWPLLKAFQRFPSYLQIKDVTRQIKKAVVASSLEELQRKSAEKFGNVEWPQIHLDSDGTEIDDEDYFQTLEPNTELIAVFSGEQWIDVSLMSCLIIAYTNHLAIN